MDESRRVALAFDPHRRDKRWGELALGVTRFARNARAWRLVLAPFPLMAPKGTYSGVISMRSDLAQPCAEAGLPLVCVSWHSFTVRVPRVAPDHRLAGQLAARHLAGRGYEHLGYVGLLKDPHSRFQEEGFRAAGRSRASSIGVLLIPTMLPTKLERSVTLRRILAEWLDELRRPVGIFACRDLFALHLANLCREKGIRVPDEVGLLGAGNDAALVGLAAPPLSSVEFHYEQVGYRAAAYLDHLMAGHAPIRGNVRVAPSLVARGSTDRWGPADAMVTAALAHIAAHSHERVRTAEVAAAAGTSTRVLLRRFRRVRRATIAEEIARVRLQRARELLEATELSVAAVARACGFSGTRRMSAAFRKHEGVSPTAWRRRVREAPSEERATVSQIKRLLVGSERSVAEIARGCGYRSVGQMAEAFREAEFLTPEEYRSIYRPSEPLPAAPPRVEIRFVGPTEEELKRLDEEAERREKEKK